MIDCKNCSNYSDCTDNQCPLYEMWLSRKRERLGMFIQVPEDNHVCKNEEYYERENHCFVCSTCGHKRYV